MPKYLTIKKLNSAEFQRIFSKVKINPARIYLNTPCWEWTGSRSRDGYAQASFRGIQQKVHRITYAVFVKRIPTGRMRGVLDHMCDNKSCINPVHLEFKSNRDNVLRGNGMSAQYARRTHCGNGHPLSGENLRMVKGARHCITCKRAIGLAYYYRSRQRLTSDTSSNPTAAPSE